MIIIDKFFSFIERDWVLASNFIVLCWALVFFSTMPEAELFKIDGTILAILGLVLGIGVPYVKIASFLRMPSNILITAILSVMLLASTAILFFTGSVIISFILLIIEITLIFFSSKLKEEQMGLNIEHN